MAPNAGTHRVMWRTIKEILCAKCIGTRTSAILAKLFGNSETTCERCGYKAGRF